MKKILIVLAVVLLFVMPDTVSATIDSNQIKEVILVRGSKMTICPFDNYSSDQKSRIADNQPYLDSNENYSFHPNPIPSSENATDCKELLYGQLEFVPYGQQPTYIPSEYIYGIDNMILREDKVFISKPQSFSDEKMLYKKILSFKAQDDVTGLPTVVPDTIFWFRGTEIYGRIGDVSEGVVKYKGKYFRHDGRQLFLNHTIIWTNHNPSPTGNLPSPIPTSVPQVINIPIPEGPIPTWYTSGISWKSIPFDVTTEDVLRSDNLQSWLNPPGRLIGYVLNLPESLVTAQGLTAQLKSCQDESCTQNGFDEVMFIVDEKGRLLDQKLYSNKIDLNTEYFRNNRKIYLLVGSKNAPGSEGVKFKFYWGLGIIKL